MGFWSAVKQVWTIARHSIVQALRMRVVLILAAFLIVVVPTLPFLLTTQSTRVERLQMVITYCVYLLSFLLAILTLFLSSNTLNTEIKNQHVFLLDPKPVPRYVLLLGKTCGVMLIDLMLLTVMMGATYGVVRYMARPPSTLLEDRFLQAALGPGVLAPNADLRDKLAAVQKALEAYSASRTEADVPKIRGLERAFESLAQKQEAQARVQTQILNARQVAAPPAPDIAVLVDKEYEKRKAQNLLESGKSEEWEKNRLRAWMARWTVPPRTEATWVIPGVPKLKSGNGIVLLFRPIAVGTRPDATVPQDYNLPGEIAINADSPNAASQQSIWTSGKVHTFAVRSDVIGPDGLLKFTYTNFDPNVAVQFSFDDGIQVLYPVASLAENFSRAGLVIFMRLTFIAIVGIFASTFLSYPVAVLLNMAFLIVGYLAPFIFNFLIEHVVIFGDPVVPPWSPVNRLDALFRWVLGGFFTLFPNFGQFNVVPGLSGGLLISGGSMLSCFLLLPLVRGGVLAVAAWIIFNRRELAAVSPAS